MSGIKHFVDTDKLYGRLLILQEAPQRGKQRHFYCQCLCGNIINTRISSLKNGNTQSCGCYMKEICAEVMRRNFTTHGLATNRKSHPLLSVWSGMKKRCYNRNDKGYKNYGARGITICDEWRNDFKAFYDWAMANGYQAGLEIDREENNGNYEPSNCRFVMGIVNARNKRNITLSIEKAQEIRGKLINGNSQNSLAREYNTHQSSIWKIKNNRMWV